MIRERDIEQALIRAVRKAGGLCLKFVSPGWSGAPDRMCLFFPGRAVFVEVKAPGRKPRPLQIRRAQQLERLGFPVYVVDSKEAIEELLQGISEPKSGAISDPKSGGGGDA